jgi:serine/threonine protein kinase
MIPDEGNNPPIFASNTLYVAIEQIFMSQQILLDLAFNEIAILSQCNHPNLIYFYDVVWQVGDGKISIMMEHADCGSLTELIDDYESARMDEDHIALVCCDVSSL